MDDKKLKKIYTVIFLSAAAVLVAVCLISVWTEPQRVAARQAAQALANQADAYEWETAEAEVFDLAPTPEPTPIPPAVGAEAVEILKDKTPLFILPSREEAEETLKAYLEACRIETATERTLYATFDCELILVDATDNIPCYTKEEALKILTADLSLIPVKMTTERRELTDTPIATETKQDSTLPAGTRIVTLVGTDTRTVTVTELTYVGGVQTAATEPVTENLKTGSATLIRVGTGVFTAATDTKENKKAEATTVAADIGMTLTLPLNLTSTDPVNAFGVTDSVFCRGVDFEAEAGSTVFAPAEGIVIYCGERSEYGFTVDIDHGNGCVSRLTHLENVTLLLNQRVFAGDSIGTLSADGMGDRVKPLLHYELTVNGVPVDPTPYWTQP